MSQNDGERVQVELSGQEARLVIAALRQFEPYWPADEDALGRAELLAGVREAIDHVTASLEPR